MAGAMNGPGGRAITISGWRFIPQSFAVVCEHLSLELLRRGPEVRLYFQDRPYIGDWRPVPGMLGEERESALRAIPLPPPDLAPDAELRIEFPYDFIRPSRAARTLVFGTAEYLAVPTRYVAGNLGLAEAQRKSGFGVLTCSNWSKQGFVRAGVPADSVSVVPLGFDPLVFRPATPDSRASLRAGLNIPPDDFVFYSAGTMRPNKGLGLLVPAFAELLRSYPHARLLLKGLDSLYSSRQFLDAEVKKLAGAHPALASRITYIGDSRSAAQMAALYQAADCYISPYMGEGFNLPVLEAAACGLPVICTAGGPTDDFVTDDFALRIPGTLQRFLDPDMPDAMGLVPDVNQLFNHMECVITEPDFCAKARAAGPKHVGERYTWSRVVDRLLPVLFPAA